jgi:hypothetical protein
MINRFLKKDPQIKYDSKEEKKVELNPYILTNPFEQIKHDIKNYRPLTSKQIDYIFYLNNVQKLELLETYNEVMISLNQNIDKL